MTPAPRRSVPAGHHPRCRAAAAGGLIASLLGTAVLAAGGSAATSSLPRVPVRLDGRTLRFPAQVPSGGVAIHATVGGTAPDRTLAIIALDPGVTYDAALGRVGAHGGDLDYLDGYARLVLDAQLNHGAGIAQVALGAGNYVAVDTTAAKPSAWSHVNFTVTPAAAPAPLPHPAATVQMIDFRFRGPDRLRVGELVRYVNAGFLVHMALGFRVPNAAAARQLSHDLEAGRVSAAERLAETVYSFAGALSPGAAEQQPVATAPGIYVLGCFMNSEDGRDHTVLGMVRTITVTR